jgi:hypothetical protein
MDVVNRGEMRPEHEIRGLLLSKAYSFQSQHG